MSVLAAIRPDSWDMPLFLHVLGGMVMVGALTLSLVSLIGAWRSGSPALTRLGFRSLLYGAVPAFLVMRIAAQWLLDKEGLEDADFAWIDIGFMTTDMGVLFLIVATVLVGLAARGAGWRRTGGLRSGRHRARLAPVGGLPGRRLGDDNQAGLAQPLSRAWALAASRPSSRPRVSGLQLSGSERRRRAPLSASPAIA